MKVLVRDMTQVQLNWAVAQVQGWTWEPDTFEGHIWWPMGTATPIKNYNPSTNPVYGQPIIEEEGISIIRCDDDYGRDEKGFTTSQRIPVWAATNGQHTYTCSTEHQQHEAMYQIDLDSVVYGPTALIAAMRCYVLMKISKSVWNFDRNGSMEIPEELL